MTTEVDIFRAVVADLLGAEWRVLMLMAWQMSKDGYVYGMPEELTERTYYRVLRRLEKKGLVKKVGKYWRVDQEFAKRIPADRYEFPKKMPGKKPPPDKRPKG